MILFLEVGYPLSRALFLLCPLCSPSLTLDGHRFAQRGVGLKLSACNPSGERKIIAKWYSEISGS
jgi:hypothetical protein